MSGGLQLRLWRLTMKERFIENNIEYILAEDGMYYPNLRLSLETDNRSIGMYGHAP